MILIIKVLEMLDQLQFSLDSRIIKHTYFFTAEEFPTFAIKLLEELDNMFWLDKIDKTIANIAFILFQIIIIILKRALSQALNF